MSRPKLQSRVFRVGIVGMGGYARNHHEAVWDLERAREMLLICTCDLRPNAFAAEQEAWEFRRRGVRVFDNFDEMLAACSDDLDLVVIAAPIPFHSEMHRCCVSAGIACYLEKPPTLVYSELEGMIRADREAEKRTFVGFNYISERPRLALKHRLLEGAFGPIRSGSLVAYWSRDISYFDRSSWCGRLTCNGQMLLDSCFGNAVSHFVHNMLFWTGTEGLFSWGDVGKVRAELYRANSIESADTFFVEATANSVPLRFAMTHACRAEDQQTETLVCELATLRYRVGQNYQITWKDGREETLPLTCPPVPQETHRNFLRYLRQEIPRPATTLEDCRPFVQLNDLAYISSQAIHTIPPEKLSMHIHGHSGKDCVTITDIESICREFVEKGTWPDLSGPFREASSRVVSPRDLPLLGEVIEGILHSRALERQGETAGV